MPLLARCCGSCALPPQCPQNSGHPFHTWSHYSVGINSMWTVTSPLSPPFFLVVITPLTQFRNATTRNVSIGGGETERLYGHSWDKHTLYTVVSKHRGV